MISAALKLFYEILRFQRTMCSYKTLNFIDSWKKERMALPYLIKFCPFKIRSKGGKKSNIF